MINCDKAEGLLSLYIDNELDKDEKEELEKHLEICNSCRNELEELRQVISLVAGMGDEDLPQDFKDKLHGKLIQEAQAPVAVSYRRKYLKIFSTIAAGVLIFVLFRDFFNNFFVNNLAEKKSGTSSKYDMAMSAESGANENQKQAVPEASDIIATYDTGDTTEKEHSGESAQAGGQDNIENGRAEPDIPVKSRTLEDKYVAENAPAAAPDNLRGNENVGSGSEGVPMYGKDIPEMQAKASLAADDGRAGEKTFIKTVYIKVISENPGNASTMTKTYAAVNGIVAYEPTLKMAMSAFEYNPEGSAPPLKLKATYENYDKLIEHLKSTYGDSNIVFMNTEVVNDSERTEFLKAELEEITAKIKQLEEQKDNSTGEMDLLRSERKRLEDEIENTSKVSGAVYIDIAYVKK